MAWAVRLSETKSNGLDNSNLESRGMSFNYRSANKASDYLNLTDGVSTDGRSNRLPTSAVLESQTQVQGRALHIGPADSLNTADAMKISPAARVMEQFVVEHLASFPQDTKSGFLTPVEALEKLKKISSGGGLWAQKMNMTITANMLTMANGESLEVIEEYPLEQISICVCVLDDRMFEELLIFSTKLSTDKVGAVHLFQCGGNQASVISEVINRSKENRARLLDHTNSVQNGNIEVSVEAQRQPLSLQQRHVVARAVDAFQQKAIEKPVDEQKKAVPMADLNGNLTPLQDARINRDVEILNKCIEEVENFVVLLKRINEARRQLASKRSSKKKKVHDILMLQAQPPPDEKVIEIYRKFKHSFNLLAKLRPHITAPNAPELIHYLIIPLNIIVKVTGMDKPRDVVEPLLSGVCVELLRSCLDSREYHFWQSLGPNWTLTKQSEQFKDKYIPPYAPIFSDGWVPPEIVVNEQQEAAVRSTAAMAARMKTPPADIIQESMTTVHSQPQPTSNSAYQPRLVAIVLYDYIAHNNKELTIRAGEKLDVLNNSRRWWLVKNDHGEQGYVPSTVLEIATQEVLDVAGDVPDGPVYTSAYARPLEGAAPLYGKVMKNRSPTEQLSRTASSFSASGQASSRSGAPVATYAQANGVSAHPPLSAQSSYHSIAPVVISVQLPDGSQLTPRTTVDASGQQRHIVELPANIVLPQAAVESNAVARAPPAVLVKKTSVPNQGSASIPATNRMSTYAPVPPPAPPPPPVIAPTVSAIKAAAQLQRAGSTQVNGGFDSAKGDLQSELRNRLSRVDLDSQQQVANMDNVDVFIPLFKSSTADDVGRWLYKLGFSDQTIDVLKSKTAKDLFKMDKQALVDAIGHDEGIQLFEELQVQNGAQTRNKTMTEFQRALVKRLQKREEKQEQSREEHPRRFEDQANVVKLSQEEVDRVRLPSKKTEAASVRSFAIADGVSGKSKV